jgi:flap endonuclease-1
MGIRGLNNFIKKICPECIIEKKIENYNGKIFAIDSSILLYKYRHIATSCETSHINGFINRVLYYLNNNIIPLFVFDGVPPEQKKITLEKRQVQKRKIYEKIEILQELLKSSNDDEQLNINSEITRLSSQLVHVTKKHILDIQELLNILGIPYITAPDEAEKFCVYLYKNKIVDYVVSDDTDVFAFGCNNVLKTSIKSYITEINIDILKQKIDYDNKKFLDFCILSGCDYLPTIPGLANNTIYNLFKKYNNIDDIINLKKYTFPEDYNYYKTRTIFNEFNYENYDNLNLTIKKVDLNKLEVFLNEKNVKNFNKILIKFK